MADDGLVSQMAGRAEDIAALLVSNALGARAVKWDADGRQSVVDFMLDWPDGRRGALEVTVVTHPESSAWQGLAARDGWRWPARSGWEFRLHHEDLPYQRARNAALKAIKLCDRERVDALDRLSPDILLGDAELQWLSSVGDLRRTSFKPGVVLLPAVRAEFVEATTSDFATTIESWLLLPHMPRHVEKTRSAPDVDERHLFLAPVDDVLPARFFTNDFPPPTRNPEGFSGIDGIWVWSNFWHQYLGWRDDRWRWIDFPPKKQP